MKTVRSNQFPARKKMVSREVESKRLFDQERDGLSGEENIGTSLQAFPDSDRGGTDG